MHIVAETAESRGSSLIRWLSWQDRSRRVIVLLASIVVLSAADLIVTIGHLKSTGMIEANPIAAYLIQTLESPWALTMYKALTVLICVSLLYRVRRFLAGEIAAWISVGILVVLSFMWRSYSNYYDSPEQVILAQTGVGADQWMRFD